MDSCRQYRDIDLPEVDITARGHKHDGGRFCVGD